ncbi:hypothetical protein E2C01_010485 [Portunus trituberculatus]|uniref:Uncharacterized protein n=1 Tax=Portunus trituberculatus TaxID=210409 RepID=A0A5B7D8K7_PORTR|nr:hypothetical protein [Portunus trituberculatus]
MKAACVTHTHAMLVLHHAKVFPHSRPAAPPPPMAQLKHPVAKFLPHSTPEVGCHGRQRHTTAPNTTRTQEVTASSSAWCSPPLPCRRTAGINSKQLRLTAYNRQAHRRHTVTRSRHTPE